MQRDFSAKLLLIFFIWLLAAGMVLADKPAPRIQELLQTQPIPIAPGTFSPMLRSSDTCTVNLGGDPAWYIYPWVIGDEIYKAFQDPSVTCDGPYPFTVEFIYLPLIYLETGTIYVSVDIEDADLSDPSCPKPGSLLAISPNYEMALQNNFYLITFSLDTPVVVDGPYFVGVYIGSDGNPGAAAVVTDTLPAPCASYNDWGEGYVDLDTVQNTDGSKVFPGRMLIYSGGTTGGSGGVQPLPAAQFIDPAKNQTLGTVIDLWANDAAGSDIIDRASFQFNVGTGWFDIGYDADDDPPLRNGITPSGSGNGLSYRWNTSGLLEDDYELRVIIRDTLGRADSSEIPVRIDPTPPVPIIEQPVVGQNICNGVMAEVACDDEDISYIGFESVAIPSDFTLPIEAISQQLGGDANGNPGDGNLAANGEYGDYCSGPAAAAMTIKYWFDQGYTYILREGNTNISDTLLMERLYTAMNVRDNLGVHDEELVTGLQSYILGHGNQLRIKINRDPGVNDIFAWMGDYHYTVMVGLSGDPGLWMTVAGSVGMADANGQFTFKMADPLTATISNYSVKQESGKLWIMYDGVWHEIGLMIGVVGWDWTVTRSVIGVDAVGSDGWSFFWNPASLAPDSVYFIHAVVNDMAANQGSASVAVYADCAANGIAGDVNHDGEVDAADIVYMSNYLYLNGPPPPGGYAAADINCDTSVDLSDLIYLFNYLFKSGPPPCP